MATYYKGYLYLNSSTNECYQRMVTRERSSYHFCGDFNQRYLGFLGEQRGILFNYLDKLYCDGRIEEVEQKKCINVLNKIIGKDKRFFRPDASPIKIIFELFKDDDGISYGKELYTNLVFPLSQSSEYIDRQYFIKRRDLGGLCDYYLRIVDTYNLPSLDLCEVVIGEYKVADQNEVLEYQNRFSKGFGRNKKRREFENTIREWYNKNVYNKEVVPCIEEPVKKEDRVSQSSETKVMASIEYLLTQMEKVNLDLYNKYQKEYEELLNGLNNEMGLKVNPPTLMAFHSLEASIKVDLFSIKHNANNILEYLTDLQKEYLVNILTDNEKETSTTFSELEKINELFLKAKSHYGLLEQRNVLKKIAFLYLMELIENIDNIDELDLENSYFVDNLNNILVHIEVLRKLGIIKCNVLIDLNDELDIKDILEIIKTIEFNKYSKEESLSLVKKL